MSILWLDEPENPGEVPSETCQWQDAVAAQWRDRAHMQLPTVQMTQPVRISGRPCIKLWTLLATSNDHTICLSACSPDTRANRCDTQTSSRPFKAFNAERASPEIQGILLRVNINCRNPGNESRLGCAMCHCQAIAGSYRICKIRGLV